MGTLSPLPNTQRRKTLKINLTVRAAKGHAGVLKQLRAVRKATSVEPQLFEKPLNISLTRILHGNNT